jgi:hypothetical protein
MTTQNDILLGEELKKDNKKQHNESRVIEKQFFLGSKVE